jgi:hypothetical protein
MKKHLLFLSVITSLLFFSCQKEVSFETGGNSEGTLQSDLNGDCLPKNVAGIYEAGKVLAASNFIEVQVVVVKGGAYTISSDTLNGIWFRSTGVFSGPGTATVKLQGSGTPTAAGVNTFTITYDSTVCTVAVTTLPAGAAAAAFTLDGSPNTCMNYHLYGTYTPNVSSSSPSNYVVIYVHVTTPGSYNVTTSTGNGLTFTGTGALAATGVDSIKLYASGTPTATGNTNLTVTAGSTTCTFPVTVTAAGTTATYTLDGSPNACMTYNLYGSYPTNTTLNSPSNYVVIYVHVTVPGTYSVTTTAVNGIVFSGTGSFAAAGVDSIKLTASGTTPAAAGSNTITVTAGGTTCTFPVTVTATGGGAAVFTLNCAGAAANGTYTQNVALVGATNTITLPVTVTTAGSYNITGTINNMTFSASGSLAVGATTITLNGTGTPTNAGNFNVPLTGIPGTCSVPVTVVAQPSNDYFPRTANSNWSYEFDGDPNDSLHRKATASTKTVGANVYTIFMGTDDASQGFDSSGYYRKAGGDYWEFIDIGSTWGLDNPLWAEYIFLKDNVNQGVSWQSAAYNGTVNGGTPITFRLNYSIAQKDVTVVVNTVSYSNVIIVNEKVDVNLAGVWTDATSQVGYSRSYYARGIGLIKYEALNPSGVVQFEVEIRRSQVF